jgi:hypothetical protein
VKNPNRRLPYDDELFAIALAIPALFAAARYIDSEREKIALARLQEARTTAVVKATTLDNPRFYHKPLASRAHPSGEQIPIETREFMNAYFETPRTTEDTNA